MQDLNTKLPLWDFTWQYEKKLLVIDDGNYHTILLYIWWLGKYAHRGCKISILVNNDTKYNYCKNLLKHVNNIDIMMGDNIHHQDFYAHINLSYFNHQQIDLKQFENQHNSNNDISTCFSFYNESKSQLYNLSAKDIYDHVLVDKKTSFKTIDQEILYPLSTFIAEKQGNDIYHDPYLAISYLSKADIIIACDNLTAQIAILLGKYTIIIADQRYSIYYHIKHKKCAIFNINDKNLYVKIGKVYRKFIREINQFIHERHSAQYYQFKGLPYQQLYQNALIYAEQQQYQVAVWLLEDIPYEYYNGELLSQLLKLYLRNKNHHKYIATIELFKDRITFNPDGYINYIHCLMEAKKYRKAQQVIYQLYQEKIFIRDNILLSTMRDFAFFLYQFSWYHELEKFIDDVKPYAPEDFTALISCFLAYINCNYDDVGDYKKLLDRCNDYQHITPVWRGEHDQNLIIFFPNILGDSILYLSIINDIIPYQQSVTLCCEERLHNLLQRSLPTIVLIYCQNDADIEKLLQTGKYDCQVNAIDLHGIIKPDLDKRILQKFLQPNGDVKKYYRQQLKNIAKNKIIIGIANTKKGERQYIDWQYWQPILSLDNVVFVNLEYDTRSKEYFKKYASKNKYNLITWQEPHPIIEFDEFTSLVSACDIIVCGTTTIVHQAGGLGVPSFVLVGNDKLDFYGLNNTQSLWYKNQYYIRPENNKRPNYKKIMISASEKIKTYIDNNFS